MAVYFQLYRLGSTEPSSFQSIDNALCHNLGLPWHERMYVEGWYDIIGFMLACGRSHGHIADYLNERIEQAPSDYTEGYRNLARINHFIMENYTTNSWCGR